MVHEIPCRISSLIISLADVKNRFKLPGHLRLANFDSTSSQSSGVKSSSDSGLAEYVASQVGEKESIGVLRLSMQNGLHADVMTAR